MKNSGRRSLAIVALSVMLGGTLGLTSTVLQPGAALAFQCLSSVTCQPANVPMLVEGGLISRSAGQGAQAVSRVAKTAKAGKSGKAFDLGVAIRRGVSTMLGIDFAERLIDEDGQEVEGDPVLGTNGLAGSTATITDDLPGDHVPGWDGPSRSVIGQDENHKARVSFAITELAPDKVRIDYAAEVLTLSGFPSHVSVGVQDRPFVSCVLPSGSSSNNAGSYISGRAFSATRISDTLNGSGVYQCGSGRIIGRVRVLSQTGPDPVPTWYPSGSPDRPEDPTATIKRTLYCADVLGAITEINDIARLGTEAGDSVALPSIHCDEGGVAIDFKTEVRPSDTENFVEAIPRRTVENEPLPPDLQEIVDHPDCWGGECELVLEEADGSSCGSVGELCPDWAKDDEAETHYRCKYAGETIDLRACSAYRRPGLGVLPNVKENGDWVEIEAPVPEKRGQEVTAPRGDPDPGADRPEDADKGRACFPEGWGVFNPLAWVYQPVKCVLSDAFVPRQGAFKNFTDRAKRAWKRSTPGLWGSKIAEVTTSLEALDNATGCDGISINLGVLTDNETHHFMAACEGDFFEPYAGTFKTFLNIAITVVGFFGVKRLIDRFVNFS